MLTIQRYNALGAMENSWLSAHYHFSFSNYYNPKKMGVGALRVINDDIVRVGGGFDMHSHKDMEIITYVRKGAITHRDNLGNEGKTMAGDVQVMSAGAGITHAEYNQEQEDTSLYQIWIAPHTQGVTPRWEARAFDKSPVEKELRLLASGLPEHRQEGETYINAHASIYGGVLSKNKVLAHPLEGAGYLLVSSGEVNVAGERLSEGDGAEIRDIAKLQIKALTEAEIVLIDLPTVKP